MVDNAGDGPRLLGAVVAGEAVLASHDLDVGGGLTGAAVGGRDDGAGVVHRPAAAVAETAEDAAELRASVSGSFSES